MFLGWLFGGREPASIPVNPPSWGSRPLPRKLGEGEFLALTTPDGSARSVVVAVAACLMGNLGLRCCEASALTLDDIDFANATVSVAATKGMRPMTRETRQPIAAHGPSVMGCEPEMIEYYCPSQLRNLMRIAPDVALDAYVETATLSRLEPILAIQIREELLHLMIVLDGGRFHGTHNRRPLGHPS